MSRELENYQRGQNYVLKKEFEDSICTEPKYNLIFLRGFFEKNGYISNRNLLNKNLDIVVKYDDFILEILSTFKFSFEKDRDFIIFYNYNSLDFLSKLYDDSDARYRDEVFYEKYINWATLGLEQKIPNCLFFKADENAILPQKERASDVGYDLTIIKEVKKIGQKTTLYDTGIIVAPDFGYYTKIVPRSSIIKSGYMLTNSTGIIDGTYRGNLMICLTKIDDSMPNLELPFRCCQLILDRSLHYTAEEVKSIDELGVTDRGAGGFGSTNK
jgi:dUTP pyrophosphatase